MDHVDSVLQDFAVLHSKSHIVFLSNNSLCYCLVDQILETKCLPLSRIEEVVINGSNLQITPANSDPLEFKFDKHETAKKWREEIEIIQKKILLEVKKDMQLKKWFTRFDLDKLIKYDDASKCLNKQWFEMQLRANIDSVFQNLISDVDYLFKEFHATRSFRCIDFSSDLNDYDKIWYWNYCETLIKKLPYDVLQVLTFELSTMVSRCFHEVNELFQVIFELFRSNSPNFIGPFRGTIFNIPYGQVHTELRVGQLCLNWNNSSRVQISLCPAETRRNLQITLQYCTLPTDLVDKVVKLLLNRASQWKSENVNTLKKEITDSYLKKNNEFLTKLEKLCGVVNQYNSTTYNQLTNNCQKFTLDCVRALGISRAPLENKDIKCHLNSVCHNPTLISNFGLHIQTFVKQLKTEENISHYKTMVLRYFCADISYKMYKSFYCNDDTEMKSENLTVYNLLDLYDSLMESLNKISYRLNDKDKIEIVLIKF